MSQEAMWWYEEHKQALEGLLSCKSVPKDERGISQLYLWLTRLTKRERPNFKEFASRLAGHYVFGITRWSERVVADMQAKFNYRLEGMNIGASAAATAKVKMLVELFGLERIVYEVSGKAIIMELGQAS